MYYCKRKNTASSESGAVTVEGSISFALFALVLFVMANLFVIAYRTAALDWVMNRTVRWALLGQSYAGETREDSIITHLQDRANLVGISIDDSDVSICPISSPGCSPNDAGGSSEYVRISVALPMSVGFGGYSFNLSSSMVVRNEPF